MSGKCALGERGPLASLFDIATQHPSSQMSKSSSLDRHAIREGKFLDRYHHQGQKAFGGLLG